MKDRIALATPLAKDTASHLHAGDEVLISGIIGLAGPSFCQRILESDPPESEQALKDRILICCPGAAEEQFLHKAFELGISGVLSCAVLSPALLQEALKHGVVFFDRIDGDVGNEELTEQLRRCEGRSDEVLCEWVVTDFPALVSVDSGGRRLQVSSPEDGVIR